MNDTHKADPYLCLIPSEKPNGSLVVPPMVVLLLLASMAIPFVAIGLLLIREAIVAKTGWVVLPFGLLFAAIGAYLLYHGMTEGRRRKADAADWQLRTLNGAKPWLAREDWAARLVRPYKRVLRSPGYILGLVVFLALGIAVFIFEFLQGETPRFLALPWNQRVLTLLMLLIGFGLLMYYLKEVLAWRRYGTSLFEMNTPFGVIGGRLEGRIQTEKPLDGRDEVRLCLMCKQRPSYSPAANNAATSGYRLWRDEKTLTNRDGLTGGLAGQSSVPVSFEIPEDAPESYTRDIRLIFWELELRRKRAGLSYVERFEVPVFKRADL